MNRSRPGLPVHHRLPEFTQTHVHRIGDAIQPPHPLSSPSPPAPSPSQHQGLFRWVNSLHQVAKVLEFQLQHQSFQWTPRTDLLKDGLHGSPCSPRGSQESSPFTTATEIRGEWLVRGKKGGREAMEREGRQERKMENHMTYLRSLRRQVLETSGSIKAAHWKPWDEKVLKYCLRDWIWGNNPFGASVWYQKNVSKFLYPTTFEPQKCCPLYWLLLLLLSHFSRVWLCATP